VLINSENFQALNQLKEKYNQSLDVIYIDPPYNTAASAIAYKNEYKDSSWLSLMNDRLIEAKKIMKNNGIITIAIDDEEVSEIRLLSESIFEKNIGYAVVRSNPVGRKTTGRLTPVHEYALFYGKSEESTPLPLDKDDEKGSKRYPFVDSIGRYSWLNFIRSGNNDLRTDSPTMYYPILVNSKDVIRVPKLEYISPSEGYKIIDIVNDDEEIVLPIKFDNGTKIEKNWQRGWERLGRELLQMDEYRVRRTAEGIKIDFKARMDDEALPRTWWEESKYASSNYGAMEMKNLFVTSEFSYPKSCYLVIDCLITSGLKNTDSICLDFFAGSGTTGHATIKLNREDSGNRKFILVEMGTYFNTVTKPRIQKVIYSDNWKNGKPQDKGGISQIVKYQVLESYEDTLNNLFLQSNLELDFNGKAKDEYLIQYMLELESRDHLFNLEMFRKPFDYQLKVTENNELKATKIDLVETFNYLIGLYVSKVQRVKDIKVVEGTTRTGIKTLVIWRDLETTTHDEVEKLLRRFYDSQRTKEFQQIYINGDHHLENLRSEGDQFKIKLIEETFFKKMFNEIEL
jgi:adenine-specific DNA-methyltransferase